MSVLTTITDLADELEDPGVVSSIQQHVAAGCPLAPLVECVTPQYDHEDRARVIAAMVERAREVIAHQNEHAANDASSELIHTRGESQTPRQGRPKSEERAVRKMAAKLAGVSEETVRRHQKAEEPAEPIVPKPPTIDKQLQKAHELLSEAQSVLEPIKKDIEAIREDFSKKDGRWALLGSVAQAANQARLGAEYVAHARTYLGDMERAKHMKGGNKRPVGAFEVAKGQDSYQESLRPRKADPEAMAQGEQHRHNFEQDEARGRKESLRLAEESKAARIASGGGLKVPGGRRRVKVTDEAGQLLAEGRPPAEETANAWADAARVGVGPDDSGDAF